MSKQQTEIKPYYRFNTYDDIMKVVDDRDVSEWELESYPYIRGFDGKVQVHIDGSWRDINEQALQQFLNLLGIRCGTIFSLETFNDFNTEEMLNEIFSHKWNQRYDSKKARPVIWHLSKDIFSPQGEIRASTTDLFRRLSDADVGRFLEYFDDFEFREGMMWPSHTRFDFRSTKHEVEVKPGDVVQIGLSFSNSEFATRSLQVAFNTFRLICSNGVVSRERFYNERIIHKRKNEADFYNGVSESVRKLNYKVDGFAKSFKAMSGKKVNIDKIEDILEIPITNSFARIAQEDKAGIIKSFKVQEQEEGMVDKITRMDIFNAATRYVRDNRELEKKEILMKGISGLMGN